MDNLKGYKRTEIGVIPNDWKLVKVKDIGEVFTGKTPSTSKDIYWNGNIPFITPEDMTGGKYVYKTNRHVTIKGANKSGKILPPNTLLVVCIGSTVGKVALTYKKSVSNQQINSIICKEDVDHDYIYYAIAHKSYLLRNYSGVAAVPIVKKSLFEGFKIPLPERINEQKKIAEILSTVDKAIEKVDESIAKTERLKKGLMQKLLTEGIGHKEFKETEIGKIPKEWKIIKLGDVCTQRKETILPKGKEKFVFIGLEHIEPGKIKTKSFSTNAEIKSAKFKFYSGDILYGKLRPYLDKAIVSEFGGICSTDLLVLNVNEEIYNKYFMVYVLHSERFIRYAVSNTSGTNHPRTSWSAISTFKLVYPPLPEQKKIAEILSTTDNMLELLNEKKERLTKIKKGLMNVLLTGKIRVKV